MRNPNSKSRIEKWQPPSQSLVTKSATGITKVVDGDRPLTHGESPLTMATDKANWGVSNDGPSPSVPRADGPTNSLPAKRGGWSVR